MGIYDRYVLPHLVDSSCNAKPIRYQRKKVVPGARGRVLEIGLGSGLNLPYYDSGKIDFVWGLEPSAGMRNKAKAAVAAAPFEVKWLDVPGEEIPLDNNSVDTVVLTYTLCTIPDAVRALGQMKRVLKPGGEMLFSEHGAAPDESVKKWQDRINPLWKLFGGGCNVNRPIPELIEEGGFKVSNVETMYLPSTPKWVGFNYWGSAT
jgi:ubiquinone/menaquinone biosynthesis C-methylase UbiE